MSKLMKASVDTTKSFLSGWMALFKSFGLVNENTSLIKFFVIPFVLNLIILTTLIIYTSSNANSALDGLLKNLLTGDAWYYILIKPFLLFAKFFIIIILYLVLLLIMIFLYSILGGIVTAPFNDIISQRVEVIKGIKQEEEKFSVPAAIADVILVIKNIIKMILFMVLINALLFVLNIVPFFGQIAFAFLSFLVTMFFLGFQFFEFPFERRGLTFGQKLKIAWKFKMMVVGLGSGFFVISAIPIVGFLSLNVATVGATTLFVDNINPVLEDGIVVVKKDQLLS